MDYMTLKEKYNKFIYHSYNYQVKDNKLEINYDFEIENLTSFKPTWKIDIIKEYEYNKEVLDELVFSLGMVELVSYYKAVMSNQIIIKCHHLNEEQINFWRKLYLNGLGEFFYLNKIDYLNVNIDIISESIKKYQPTTYSIPKNQDTLIPIGGGKDSIVTIELLKNKVNSIPYVINPRGATLATIEKSNLKDAIFSYRTIDKNLLELNKQGYLNGHTPYSAIVAFSSTIASLINGLSYVALSNENSANEPTIIGTTINHQYSKSFEFEEDYINYEKKYINSNVSYFSLLRGYSELKIASLFSKCKNYHDIFKSCNVGSKNDIWCGSCPKCLFVYIILSPFLSKEELIKIFDKNLLNDLSLLNDFKKLTGLASEKPFECVGSRDEVNASIQYLIDNNKEELDNLLKYYKDNYKGEKYSIKPIIDEFNYDNAIPNVFMEILKNEQI